MQTTPSNHGTCFKLIAYPERAVEDYPLVTGETPQPTIPCEQRPTSLLCKRECKGIGRRELGPRTPYLDCPRELCGGQIFELVGRARLACCRALP